MRSPYVLFAMNGIMTMTFTIFLFIWFIDFRLVQQPQAQQSAGLPFTTPGFDSSVLGSFLGRRFVLNVWYYFLANLAREAIQIFVEVISSETVYQGMKAYATDIWNITDMAGPICYFIGNYFHEQCFSDSENRQCSWKDVLFREGAEISPWGVWYALAIFLSFIRVLRIFYMTEMGVIINIFGNNFAELLKIAVIYLILLCGISALFMGFSEYTSLVPGVCVKDSTNSTHQLLGESESGIISCNPAYFFIRPLFQSFGEFSLGEMNNSASIILVVTTFVMLNLMLFNLLIAMMTSTYETKTKRAKGARLLYKYSLLVEHSRWVVAVPLPLNVPSLVIEIVYFWFQYDALKHKYPDCTVWQRFDLFLSRNIRPSKTVDVTDKEEAQQMSKADQKIHAGISAFMERARAVVINTNPPKDSLEGKVDSMASDMKHIQEISEGIRNHTNTLHGKGGQIGRSQKFEDRRRDAAQHRIAMLREKGFEQGKKALTIKKLTGEDERDDPHFFSRKRPGVAYDDRDRDEDEEDYLKQLEADNKALRATNSRLITLLDQKSVEALSAFERRPTGDDPCTFKSGEHEHIAVGRSNMPS